MINSLYGSAKVIDSIKALQLIRFISAAINGHIGENTVVYRCFIVKFYT